MLTNGDPNFSLLLAVNVWKNLENWLLTHNVEFNMVASDLFDLDWALDKLEVEDDVIAREIKNNNIRIVFGILDSVSASALFNTGYCTYFAYNY